MKKRIIIGFIALLITTLMAIQSFILLDRAKAILAAKKYKPEPYILCAQALTPATHTATGAKHTFPNGCLAPGWAANK